MGAVRAEGGVSREIAEFVAAARFEDLPAAIVHEAKRSLLNIIGTGISGARDETVEIALRALSRFSGRADATVIGRGERIDALGAAFLNAASANVSDFDDTHAPTVIHPSAPVAPVLFALAELRPVTGAELLLGFALGVEIACRMGIAVSPAHYRRGWHVTATCGVLGAAMAAGKLLRLDPARLVWALGNAATQSCGLVESLGHPAKSLSIGNAARNGLLSAVLAEDGFSGPERPLEGRFGFLAVMGAAADTAPVGGYGESWELARNSYKVYPGGVVIHPAIDCALAVRAWTGWILDDVADIVVRGHRLLCERGDRPDVTTGREAQLSVQHSVAVALLFGRVGLAEYTDGCVNDPAVLALRGKVRVEEAPEFAVEGAAMEVVMRDGARHRASVAAARGSLARPPDDAELERKFLDLAGALRPAEELRRLIDMVWGLDRARDAAELLALSTPGR